MQDDSSRRLFLRLLLAAACCCCVMAASFCLDSNDRIPPGGGPSCRRDSDCEGKNGCVRCAGSGKCTSVRLSNPSCRSNAAGPSCSNDLQCQKYKGCGSCVQGRCSTQGSTPKHDDDDDDRNNRDRSKLNEPGNFDYWVLAQSWAPRFCCSQGSAINSDHLRCGECNPDYQAAYPVYIHGLWPQFYNRNQKYPVSCPGVTWRSSSTVCKNTQTDPLVAPGWCDHLYENEWERHGTCSGLDEQEYYQATWNTAEHTKSIMADVRNFHRRKAQEQGYPAHVQVKASQLLALFPDGSVQLDCTAGGTDFAEFRTCFDWSGNLSPLDPADIMSVTGPSACPAGFGGKGRCNEDFTMTAIKHCNPNDTSSCNLLPVHDEF